MTDLYAGQVSVEDRLPELRHQVTASTVVLGALATRDWRPMHHDRDFAIHHNGIRDIFLNTPSQAAWFERYLTDWTGPRGRLARLTFAMKDSVFPGDLMTLSGRVTGLATDPVGCAWAEVELALSVSGAVRTSASARIALPVDRSDNPWARRGERWCP
ncbi:hypothetical protein EFK50_09800 [Nocardioides marmoriginsengisoli]|uniref:MaoC-like domain-containing protein n=1 Tax=Nocardioides marmoriginsengisoli TaxID=661483 RepID=A0A3N0CF59_9ACTN|nr:hypothetical protein [Nocardioides marmoriginsengisoli]RNL62097.1 hypothetical protein EFK50_09800 [Nocardioides marmoriginsengisoli]